MIEEELRKAQANIEGSDNDDSSDGGDDGMFDRDDKTMTKENVATKSSNKK